MFLLRRSQQILSYLCQVMTEKYDMKTPSRNQMIEADEHFKICSILVFRTPVVSKNSHRGIPLVLPVCAVCLCGVKAGQGRAYLFSKNNRSGFARARSRRAIKYFFGVFSAENFIENIYLYRVHFSKKL